MKMGHIKPVAVYNNFNTYEWLDYQYSYGFNGGDEAIGISRPSLSEFYPVTDTIIRPVRDPRKTNSDNFSGDFLAVAGKGKLCKGAGLSGAEKRACKKNIKSTCGKKPMFGRAKKEKWATCAGSNVVTPEQSAQETADKLSPTREDSGLSTGAKAMIGVGVVGFLALIGFAIANKKKAQPAMMQKPSAMVRR